MYHNQRFRVLLESAVAASTEVAPVVMLHVRAEAHVSHKRTPAKDYVCNCKGECGLRWD